MTKYEDECVCCSPEMGCMGNNCTNRNVKHLYCDECHADYDELYVVGDEELCEDCLKEQFEIITL